VNWGNQTIPVTGSDTISLSIFKNTLGNATFSLINPKLKFTTYNSFGIPVSIGFSQLEGVTQNSTFQIPNSLPYNITVSSPTINQVGQTLVATDSLYTGNSSIGSVINNTSKQIVYSLNAQSTAVSQSNFVLDTSNFKLNVEIDLPLYGTASNFVLTDTITNPLNQQSNNSNGNNNNGGSNNGGNNNGGGGNNNGGSNNGGSSNDSIPNYIQSGLVRLYNSNGFPMDVNLQAYFVDSAYHKLDSLISPSQTVFKSGVVNLSGMVTAPTATTLDIPVDNNRIKNITNSKYIIIQGALSTTNSGKTNVKLYSYYTLLVRLGIQIQGNIKVHPGK